MKISHTAMRGNAKKYLLLCLVFFELIWMYLFSDAPHFDSDIFSFYEFLFFQVITFAHLVWNIVGSKQYPSACGYSTAIEAI